MMIGILMVYSPGKAVFDSFYEKSLPYSKENFTKSSFERCDEARRVPFIETKIRWLLVKCLFWLPDSSVHIVKGRNTRRIHTGFRGHLRGTEHNVILHGIANS